MCRKLLILNLLIAFTTSGCSHTVVQRHPNAILYQEDKNYKKEQNDLEINQRIVENDKTLSTVEEESSNEGAPLFIPIEINNRVAAWIHYFTVRRRDLTTRYFERASAFKEQLERILEENNVPKELLYLAMIESGFITQARSRARAVGLWQMIPGTARNYGLIVNRDLDERRNWIKCTEAAITYLKDLKNVFGSWYLAFAAYNAGEYRIVRSIMRGKSRDFWALAEGKMLPRETLNYVPKFLAMLIIGKNPEKYNINFKEREPLENYKLVEVPSRVKLHGLARASKIPLKTIRLWNQDILRNFTPYKRSGKVEIYLPVTEAEKIKKHHKRIARLRRYSSKRNKYYARTKNRSGYSIYVVKRGDNLSSIATKLKISLRTLIKINRLKKNKKIHPGQRLRYYTTLSPFLKKQTYKVRQNDTLSEIARRNKTTTKKLKKLNNLKGNKIYKGQRLRLPASSYNNQYHTVQRGESLYTIAQKYNTSIPMLQTLNKIKERERIYPGQRLIVKRK